MTDEQNRVLEVLISQKPSTDPFGTATEAVQDALQIKASEARKLVEEMHAEGMIELRMKASEMGKVGHVIVNPPRWWVKSETH